MPAGAVIGINCCFLLYIFVMHRMQKEVAPLPGSSGELELVPTSESKDEETDGEFLEHSELNRDDRGDIDYKLGADEARSDMM